MFAGAALCLAGQGLAVAAGRGTALRSPLVLLPAALAIWSALAALAADFPGIALAGAPQQGLGAAWFLALAAYTAAALDLRTRRWADALITLAAIATSVAVICNLRHLPWLQPLLARHGLEVPVPLFSFNEYLAYPALALAAIGAARLDEGRRRVGAAMLVIALATLIASRNRSAMAAMAVVTPLATWMWLRGSIDEAWYARRPRRAAAMVTAAVAAVALIPLAVLRLADLGDAPFSLRSRQVLLAVLDPSLLDHPLALLVGHGWGHYQETLARNVASTGIALFAPGWADLGRDEFHSHHALVEALFSAGLPAAALTLALPVAVVAVARRKAMALGFVLAWAFVDALWFSLPSTLALQALAVAALAEDRPTPPAPRGAAIVCLLLAAAMAVGAVCLRTQAIGIEAVRACFSAPPGDEGCRSPAVPVDPRGSELGLAALLGEIHGPAPSALVDEASRRCRSGCALQVSIALADIHAARAFATPRPADFSPAAWREEELRIMQRAPGRLDLLTPYLNWLVVTGDRATLGATLAEAARHNAGHPVVLWFAGTLDLAGPPDVQQRGVTRMRLALDRGLERFMPVAAEVRTSLHGVNR